MAGTAQMDPAARTSTAEVTEAQPHKVAEVILPSGIDGLDTVNGLSHMLGKKSLYLSILRKFVAGQKDTAAEIFLALEDKNLHTAERLAHTLKGVAGTIGATELQGLAERLESAIKDGRPQQEIDAQFDELKMPLGISPQSTGKSVTGSR